MLRRVLVLLVLGTMLLAACGGDDGGSPDTAANEGETGTTAATGDGATASTGGGTTGATGDAGAGIFGAGECAEVAAAMAAAAQGSSAAMSGSTPDFEQAVEQLEAFAEVAPEEISADVAVLVEAYRAVAEVFANADYDPSSGEPPPPEVLAELPTVLAELGSEEFLAAVERVGAYIQAGCQA